MEVILRILLEVEVWGKGVMYPFFSSQLLHKGYKEWWKKASDLGMFKGFIINTEVEYKVMQFVDDTIIVGEISWENLWSIKEIMRGF